MRAAGDAIEGAIRTRFRDHVSQEYGETDEQIMESLNSVPNVDPFVVAYGNYQGGGSEPLDALTRVLLEDSFEKTREHPIGALIELGRRAGYLTPWANVGQGGKLQKRYTATAEFLETLVAATVEPEDPLEFPEFLDRLREDFGIVVGRPQDDVIIRCNNLLSEQFGTPTSINEGDLRRNVERMRILLIETGYGRAYADGRTIVTTQPQGAL